MLVTAAGLAAACALGLLIACFIAVTTLATGLLLGAGAAAVVLAGVAAVGFACAMPTLSNKVDNTIDIFMGDTPKNRVNVALINDRCVYDCSPLPPLKPYPQGERQNNI